jgi:hypothetical protein
MPTALIAGFIRLLRPREEAEAPVDSLLLELSAGVGVPVGDDAA